VKKVFLLILTWIIDIHLFEQWFDIASNGAVLHPHFRIDGEETSHHVEIPMRPKEGIHSLHIGVLNARRKGEIWSISFGSKCCSYDRLTAAHEFAGDADDHNTIYELIAEGREMDRDIG
jgi:hypothetical protein